VTAEHHRRPEEPAAVGGVATKFAENGRWRATAQARSRPSVASVHSEEKTTFRIETCAVNLRFVHSGAIRLRSGVAFPREKISMDRQSPVRRYTAAFIAASMLASSAASAAPRTIDPLVALSAFGTAESQAAVCAAGSAAAAAGAAVAAQGAQPGCVLPVVDAAPAPMVEAPPPPIVEPVAVGGGIGVLPLLLALAALAAAAILVLKDDDDDDEIVLPISP